jgi:hypothetical protein
MSLLKRTGTAMACVLAVALCAALLTRPASAKKNVEYLDGVMLGEEYAVKFRTIGGSAGSSYDEFHFFIQVGQVVYVGAYRKDMIFQYKPKAADWPAGMPVQVRFEKKSAFGLIHTTFMYVRRPNTDKEVITHLFSVMGPDGKQKCGHFFCN